MDSNSSRASSFVSALSCCSVPGRLTAGFSTPVGSCSADSLPIPTAHRLQSETKEECMPGAQDSTTFLQPGPEENYSRLPSLASPNNPRSIIGNVHPDPHPEANASQSARQETSHGDSSASYAHRDSSRIPFHPGSPRALFHSHQHGMSDASGEQGPTRVYGVVHKNIFAGGGPVETPTTDARDAEDAVVQVETAVGAYSQPSATSQLPFTYPDQTDTSWTQTSDFGDNCGGSLEAHRPEVLQGCASHVNSPKKSSELQLATNTAWARDVPQQECCEQLGASQPPIIFPGATEGFHVSPPASFHHHGTQEPSKPQGSLLTERLMEVEGSKGSFSGRTSPVSGSSSVSVVATSQSSQSVRNSLLLSSTSGSVPVDFRMPVEQQMWILAENSALLSSPSLPHREAEHSALPTLTYPEETKCSVPAQHSKPSANSS